MSTVKRGAMIGLLALAVFTLAALDSAHGTSITLNLEISKPTILILEPVYVKVTLTNTGHKDFRFNRPGSMGWHDGYSLYSSRDGAPYREFSGGVPVQNEFWSPAYGFRSPLLPGQKSYVVDMIWFWNPGSYTIKAVIEDKWRSVGEAVYESAPVNIEVRPMPPDEPIFKVLHAQDIWKLALKITHCHYYSGKAIGGDFALPGFSGDLATSMTQFASKSVFYSSFLYGRALFKTADHKPVTDADLKAIEQFAETEAHPWVRAQVYANLADNFLGRGFPDNAAEYARKGQSYEESYPLYENIRLMEKLARLKNP